MTTRSTLSVAVVTCSLLLSPALARAQDTKPAAKPAAAKAAAPAPPDEKAMMEAMQRVAAVGENHKRLEALVGEWTTDTKVWMDPSQAPQSMAGTSSNHMVLGGRFLHSLHKGDMMGQPFEGVGTTGYDNLTGKYVSTWSDSMSTGIFYETGAYDAATKTITLRGEMPDPMGPKALVKVRTTTRFVDADTYVFEWYEARPPGKEGKLLEVAYKRKK